MRDSNTANYNNLTDEENFLKFVNETRKIFNVHKFPIHVFRDHMAIIYKNDTADGILEIFVYDRPTNPRFEDGFFKFDWYVANELKTICIKPSKK